MKLGIGALPRRIEATIEEVRLAEEVGFDRFGVADSQTLYRELYASLAPVARETESIAVGPLVTNPVTRHPVVTASAVATIDEYAGGRLFLGLGSGDSAVFTIGERPARLAELERTVEACRALLRGDAAEYGGETIRLGWLPDAGYSPDVPVYVAAEGPETLKMAGRVADGVFMGLGTLPEVVEAAVEYVEAGARAAGRDPGEVEKWVNCHGNVADDREAAVDEIKMAVASAAHHSLQFTMEGKRVPEEYREPLRKIVREYDSNAHERRGDTPNRRLVEDLPSDVFEYLADRYTIAGTPDDWLRKIDAIEAVGGVDGVRSSVHAEDRRAVIERLGREVIPSL